MLIWHFIIIRCILHGISFKIQSFNVRNGEFIMYEKDPVISVIMGIYNCGDTLSEAIECIVNQTFQTGN